MYVCVDCEASGPMPPLYNLLSIGATTVEKRGGRHVLGESFYIELKPIFAGFLDEAMAVCGLDRATLERDGVEPAEAMRTFAAWLERHAGRSPVFVGHNAVFDWSYIAYYFAHVGLANPFGYKGIDTKSLAMGRLGLPWRETSKETLQARLALPELDETRIHRADYDAEYQALILQALLDRPATS